MGERAVEPIRDPADLRRFTLALLRDVEAFERLLARGLFDHASPTMGVEQEMFLVEAGAPHRPAAIADRVLAELDPGIFTTELAQFNLEANLPPRALDGRFLAALREDLETIVAEVDRAAGHHGGRVALTGMLPTIRRRDLSLDRMTDLERYRELNRSLQRIRGGEFRTYIRGLDVFDQVHTNVMMEAANCSLQLHLEVAARDFASCYNLAQLISAPLLAAATNSPVLLGHRLWQETRVALFERTVDSRSQSEVARGLLPRVCFGSDWVHESVIELLREAALRFRVLLVSEETPDSVEALESGVLPPLRALALHNGTIWRWNRPCFGIHDGRAHLRIENRILPAGPTVVDEVANAALFYGLMSHGEPDDLQDDRRIHFDDIRENFLSAARHGLEATFTWLDQRKVSARALILDRLLPQAHQGLAAIGVPGDEAEHYLGIIRARVAGRRTGARWVLESLHQLRSENRDAALEQVTAAMLANQRSGQPVHEWTIAPGPESGTSSASPATVRSVMSQDLFTVAPDDPIELATSLMRWRRVRHVPVEDGDGRVVGVLSTVSLLSLWEKASGGTESIPVARVMDPTPAFVDPETPIGEALETILAAPQGCLLVLSEDRLIGIVTERDLLRAASRVIARVGRDDHLAEETAS